MTTVRQAVPNLTPVRDVLSHEERITRLERENDELRQMIQEQAICIGILNDSCAMLRQCIRISASTDLMHGDRLARLESRKQGDLRLSEVLGGIEARLIRIELGAEVMP